MFILSILLDLVFSNYLNYELSSISIFPMFTITYIIYELLTTKNISHIAISLLLYSVLEGIIFFNLLFLLLSYLIIKRFVKNKLTIDAYLLITTICLILYDTLFFILINKYSINYLVIKIARTLPINLILSLLLLYNYSSKSNSKKYKLNEMIIWQENAKKRKKIK